MLLPLTHDRTTVRSLPWVTYAVLALCLLTFFSVRARLDGVEESNRLHRAAFVYYVEHPHLEPDPLLVSGRGVGMVREELGVSPAGRQDPPAQAELDRLTAAWTASLDDNVLWRLGLVPARPSPLGAVAHMFTHAGWGHLLGNLFFLYLFAPFVEDRVGRPLFAAFYLLGGLVAGLAFSLHFPGLPVPLIGASGAVSAAMGAFLVFFGTVRIRFLYLLLVIPRTFRAPAWVALPLWFGMDLLMAARDSAADPSGLFGGVAYWAHVWGFLFGVVAALVYRQMRPASTVDDATPASADAVSASFGAALQAQLDGRPDEAWELMRREVRRAPDNSAMVDAFWALSVDLGRAERAAPVLARHVRSLLQDGDTDGAEERWRQLHNRAPEAAERPDLLVALGDALVRGGRERDGLELLRRAAERVGPQTPVGTLARLYRLVARRDRQLRRRVADVIQQHPQATPELRDEVSGELVV